MNRIDAKAGHFDCGDAGEAFNYDRAVPVFERFEFCSWLKRFAANLTPEFRAGPLSHGRARADHYQCRQKYGSDKHGKLSFE
jgi:hypothetical protein